MKLVNCRGCDRPIVWVITPAGKKMPCDPDIVTVVTELGVVVRGRIPHWSTCPERERFRRAKP